MADELKPERDPYADTDAEIIQKFLSTCREMKPVGQWPGERVCVAIERLVKNQRRPEFISEDDRAPPREYNGRGGDEDRPFSGPKNTRHQPNVGAGVEEMSPEFTDSARAAIAWVLWHHQGGSSPIGQPLRFALGMGSGEELPEWRISEAKRWAELTGSKTEDFHRAGAEDARDVAMFKTGDPMGDIYRLAQKCGAEIDGGEIPDYQAGYPGSPPTITFTDRQLENFAAGLLDGRYLYAGEVP